MSFAPRPRTRPRGTRLHSPIDGQTGKTPPSIGHTSIPFPAPRFAHCFPKEHSYVCYDCPIRIRLEAQTETPRPERTPHPLHRARLRHRHRPVLRLRRRHPGGGSVRVAGVPARRRGGVLHAPRAWRDERAQPDHRFLRGLLSQVPGWLGWLHHRLDVRLRDDDRLPRGLNRHWHLHETVVPGHSCVGVDRRDAADHRRGQPGHRALVW